MHSTERAPEVDVTVVLPGYNEERNIEKAVSRCLTALDSLGITHEVLVVNDGSTDQTPALAESLAVRNPAVRVIHNPVNLNVGISVLIGMRAARGRVVTHNSMDLPFAPEDLGKMLALLERADVVVAVRKGRAAHSPWRKITSLVHHWMVRILFWIDVRDMNFVQAYRREVLERLPVKAKSPAFVTPELIIRAKRAGYRIAEFETEFHRRQAGQANFGRPRDILWTFSDMLSFWLEGGGRR
jgi:glycosyltransferase involved in cell wall biosynthesis